jgi:hypothetical protein
MPWFVVDDNAHSHPKMIAAGNAALGLWLRCGAYAAQHLTDGVVPGVIAKMYGSKPQITKLVAAGLWHEHGHTCPHPKCAQPAPGDFYIHDYLAPYNPSRAEVERKRERAADKKRRQRGGAPERTPPGGNRTRNEDGSHANRERFDDDSYANQAQFFDEPPGDSVVSRGDSPGTRARAFPSPPLPYTDGADVEGGSTGSRAPANEPAAAGPAPIDADNFRLTDGMRRWAHRDGYAALVDIDHSTAQFISHYRSTGASRRSWPDAWQKWIRDDAKRAAERGAGRPQQGAFLVPLPGGATPGRRSTTDDRVAQGLALAAELRAAEEGNTA